VTVSIGTPVRVVTDGFVQSLRLGLGLFLVPGRLLPVLRHPPESFERRIHRAGGPEIGVKSGQIHEFDQIVRPAVGQLLQVSLIAEDGLRFTEMAKEAGFEGAFDDVTAQVVGAGPPLPPQKGLGIFEPRLGKVL